MKSRMPVPLGRAVLQTRNTCHPKGMMLLKKGLILEVNGKAYKNLPRTQENVRLKIAKNRLHNDICGYKFCRGQGKAIPNLVAKSPRTLTDMTVYEYIDSYLI